MHISLTEDSNIECNRTRTEGVEQVNEHEQYTMLVIDRYGSANESSYSVCGDFRSAGRRNDGPFD